MSKGKNELSVSNNIKHQVKNQINLVDRELEVLQSSNFFSVEPANDYSNRCFSDMVREMVRRRENLTHKCVGKTSNKIGSIFLHQKEKSKNHTLPDRQQDLSYLLKMGGTKNEHRIKLSKGIWYYLLNHNMFITAEYLPSVLLKIKQECVPVLILIAPVWSTQQWYAELLNLRELVSGHQCCCPREKRL